ncbi:MAG: DUF2232 domain-containing protein [Deltaproteobacteria bacterium]|nr:DUF2232 domain-containing protein [Deltaproteobacteria bacterium]
MRERGLNLALCNLIVLFLFFSGVFVYLTPLLLFYISKRFSLLKSFLFSAMLLLEFVLIFGLVFKLGISPEILRKVFSSLSWTPGFAYYDFFGIKGVAWGMFYYWMVLMATGLMLAYQSQFPQKWFHLVLKVAAFSFVLLVGLTIFLSKGNFFELVALMKNYLGKSFDLVLQMPKQFEGEEVLFLKSNRDLLLQTLVLVSPGFLFCFLMLMVALNDSLSKGLFRHLFEVKVQPFELMVLPFTWVWFFIATFALYLGNSYLLGGFEVEAVLVNFFVFFTFAFFFQGLAVLHLYLRRFALETWVIVLGYLSLFLVFQPLLLLISLMGILDAWFDFRKLNAVLPKA